MKRIGIVLGVILVVLVLAAATMFVIGGMKFDGPDDLPVETLAVTADSASLAWGRHLAGTHGCMECHAANLEGTVLVDAPPFLVVATNLTSGAGGVGDELDTLGWERAIRHGVGADGRGLLIMPSEMYTHMSDADVVALIAYLQSVPPVDNELPRTEVRPLGRIIAATGGLAPTSAMVDHADPHPTDQPAVAATVEYGEYRASTLCGACHGADMRGAQPPDPSSPPAPSLVPSGRWTLEQFTAALRTGRTPARQLDGDYMPYSITRHLTDAEIEALWLYLGSIPAEGPAQPVTQ